MQTMLAVSTGAVLDACRGHGVDPHEVLARVGLAPEVVRDPDARIAPARAAAVWRLAFARTGEPALALQAAEQLRFGAYRVLDYLAASAPTVGAAFEHVARYFALINPAVEIAFEHDRRGVWFALAARAAISPAYLEYALATFLIRIRTGTTIRFAPAGVELPVRGTRRHRDEQARVFGCGPRTGARAALRVPADVWHAPNPRRDADLFAVLDGHARTLAPGARPSFADEVRAAIGDALPRGAPSLTAIARRLATSRRTVQRHLDREGVRFHALVDAARLAEARALLLDHRLGIAEIAARLGFAQPSSFTRAFRRWTGRSPQAYRRYF